MVSFAFRLFYLEEGGLSLGFPFCLRLELRMCIEAAVYLLYADILCVRDIVEILCCIASSNFVLFET